VYHDCVMIHGWNLLPVVISCSYCLLPGIVQRPLLCPLLPSCLFLIVFVTTGCPFLILSGWAYVWFIQLLMSDLFCAQFPELRYHFIHRSITSFCWSHDPMLTLATNFRRSIFRITSDVANCESNEWDKIKLLKLLKQNY